MLSKTGTCRQMQEYMEKGCRCVEGKVLEVITYMMEPIYKFYKNVFYSILHDLVPDTPSQTCKKKKGQSKTSWWQNARKKYTVLNSEHILTYYLEKKIIFIYQFHWGYKYQYEVL